MKFTGPKPSGQIISLSQLHSKQQASQTHPLLQQKPLQKYPIFHYSEQALQIGESNFKIQQKPKDYEFINNSKQIQSINPEKIGDKFEHLHGKFDLESIVNKTNILINLDNSLHSTSVNIINNIITYVNYLQQVKNLDIEELRLVPTKKSLVRMCFLKEYQSILTIAMVIANKKLTKPNIQSHIQNILSNLLQNHILLMTILSHNKILHLQQIILQKKLHHLYNKGFEMIRQYLDVISSLLIKIGNVDDLFMKQCQHILKQHQQSFIVDTMRFLRVFLAFYLNAIKTESQVGELSIAPQPYLPESQGYTLVIDYQRIFFKKQEYKPTSKFELRPYTKNFLTEMSKYYQIVLLSNLLPNEANPFISKLSPPKNCHILFKYHLVQSKIDISRLGRPVDKVMVIGGNNEDQNSFCIDQWKGEETGELAELCPVLAYVVINKIDCRNASNLIRKKIGENLTQGLFITYGLSL